jgi:hypothetical protein
MARDLQTGLDFQSRPQELFEGKEMGEDALRILGEYRELLQEIGKTVASESKVLKGSLRWAKSVRLGISADSCVVARSVGVVLSADRPRSGILSRKCAIGLPSV